MAVHPVTVISAGKPDIPEEKFMKSSSAVINLAVPGWIRLLIIAGALLLIAVIMLRKLGIQKIIFRDEWSILTFCRALVFTWLIGIAIAFILAASTRLTSR